VIGGLAGLWGRGLAEQWPGGPAVWGPGGAAIWQACRVMAWWGHGVGVQQSGGPVGLLNRDLVGMWIGAEIWWAYKMGNWPVGPGPSEAEIWWAQRPQASCAWRAGSQEKIWWAHSELGPDGPKGQEAWWSAVAAPWAYWVEACWASCSFSESSCGKAFHELGVQSVEFSALPGALPQPNMSPVSQQYSWFMQLTQSVAMSQSPSWILSIFEVYRTKAFKGVYF
jgi:hypothetical protein